MDSTFTLELPTSTILHVTLKQFEALAAANRELRLEQTSVGELIVNPLTGGGFGVESDLSPILQIYWYPLVG